MTKLKQGIYDLSAGIIWIMIRVNGGDTMTYEELKAKGTLLSEDEATEFYQLDGRVYMVLKQEGNKVQPVDE